MYSIINSQMFTFNNLAQWVEQCCLHLQELLRSQRNYATSCTIDKAIYPTKLQKQRPVS